MTTPAERLEAARTLLFVPGSRPDRFAKATAAGADLTVVDLEDAVAPEGKESARSAVADWLAGGPGGQPAGVRINAPGTPWFAGDLEALAARPCIVLVPKAEDAEALEAVGGALAPGTVVAALVETAAGVLEARAIAAARGVGRLAFGSFDLAAQLGISPDDRDAMATARGALVLASAAAGIAGPVDGVTGDVSDTDRLRHDVALSARVGFTGKLCIHPAQVAVVHDAMRPSADEVAWAEQVVAAAGTGGVAVVAGQMVDKPVVDRARRLLARRR